ncbi:hypothetical protein GQF61_12170 [Sphingobacterium sp. DK4209]|uniref:Uncharacterized protein n=1 Tax=Sphingobacterium zhuxiongii TaxID=2662364 RepID=A0A5Q0QC75_9SPHI|nr:MULTISPECIES: hypothetical protein [unclassified Sphingobacterium]MVZ66615.1 hypothetical protein [Sphingobacterium sp. DK4209]QGA26799.1 hypothetical protein GFH32_10905 [Sphingobacterium sp. dk4302]
MKQLPIINLRMIKPLHYLILLLAFCFLQSCEKLESSHDTDTETLSDIMLEGTYSIVTPLSFFNLENGFELLNDTDLAPTVKKINENTYDITWNHLQVPTLASYEFKLIGSNESGELQYVASNKAGDEGILMFIIDKKKSNAQLSINLKSGFTKYVGKAALKK